MENYKFIEKLGKGAQGTAHLVESKRDGARMVLKQIECNDENDANKAFEEALALKRLDHDFICRFKELFVHWDKELSAMFMCIVMDYYTKGDLSTVIKKNREISQAIDEQVIKKWFGQILQALLFIHTNGIIHRDLKPSNIFIQEDDSVIIGGFGVPTVMDDVLTRTRSTVGTLNYMAPEVLEQQHSEKTDVWSLGCVLLELATCQHTDLSEMAGLLNKIKHDDQALDDVLDKVQATYSIDLVSVIRNMLGKNHRQRPSAYELAEHPYIRECLDLSDNILLEKQKLQRSSSKSVRAVPTDKDAKLLMEYLTDNLGDESALKRGLEQLAEITKDDGSMVDSDGKHVIAKIMKDYVANEQIQTSCCQVFVNLSMAAVADDILYSRDVIEAVLTAAEIHPKCGALQQAAANLLMALSANERATDMMGDMKAVEIIISALKHFMRDASISISCLTALWSLAVNEDNVRTLTQNKGVNVVVNTINKHLDNPELLESAFAVLLALTIEDENITVMNKLNCVGLVIDAIQEHVVEPKLVKNACLTLAAMIEADEESAFRVLSNSKENEEDVAGIPIILKAYSVHKDNAEVVENVCILLMELLEYDLVCSELYDSNLPKLLLEVKVKFMSYKDIIKPCEKALEKLGVKNPPLHT